MGFANSNQIVTREEVTGIAGEWGISDDGIEGVIQLLTDYGFLALETDADHYEWIYDETANKLIRSKARRVVQQRLAAGDDQRFSINVAYHAWLDIRSQPVADRLGK